MKIKNYAISFTMIALLVLMQFVSPFLHAHISDSSQARSDYTVHLHEGSEHSNDSTLESHELSFNVVTEYINADSSIIKNMKAKISKLVIPAQDIAPLMDGDNAAFQPPLSYLSFNEPYPLGFNAHAPPVA